MQDRWSRRAGEQRLPLANEAREGDPPRTAAGPPLQTRAGSPHRQSTERIDRSSTTPRSVRFYEGKEELARIVAGFLQEGFDRGSPGIVVATPSQRAAIIRELTNHSLDVVELERSHDLLLLDAAETLSSFMVDGKPDPRRFRDQVCQVIERARRARTHCTVRIFGQMVDLLWQDGQREAAIRLEVLWNQMARTAGFSLLCAYAIGNFYKDASVDRQHSGGVGNAGELRVEG